MGDDAQNACLEVALAQGDTSSTCIKSGTNSSIVVSCARFLKRVKLLNTAVATEQVIK